jgi:hypothetical protein
MAERARIGPREVRSLKPGKTVWDSAVAGFGGRRQLGDASIFLRMAAGRHSGRCSTRSPVPTCSRGAPRDTLVAVVYRNETKRLIAIADGLAETHSPRPQGDIFSRMHPSGTQLT